MTRVECVKVFNNKILVTITNLEIIFLLITKYSSAKKMMDVYF